MSGGQRGEGQVEQWSCRPGSNRKGDLKRHWRLGFEHLGRSVAVYEGGQEGQPALGLVRVLIWHVE